MTFLPVQVRLGVCPHKFTGEVPSHRINSLHSALLHNSLLSWHEVSKSQGCQSDKGKVGCSGNVPTFPHGVNSSSNYDVGYHDQQHQNYRDIYLIRTYKSTYASYAYETRHCQLFKPLTSVVGMYTSSPTVSCFRVISVLTMSPASFRSSPINLIFSLTSALLRRTRHNRQRIRLKSKNNQENNNIRK